MKKSTGHRVGAKRSKCLMGDSNSRRRLRPMLVGVGIRRVLCGEPGFSGALRPWLGASARNSAGAHEESRG